MTDLHVVSFVFGAIAGAVVIAGATALAILFGIISMTEPDEADSDEGLL